MGYLSNVDLYYFVFCWSCVNFFNLIYPVTLMAVTVFFPIRYEVFFKIASSSLYLCFNVYCLRPQFKGALIWYSVFGKIFVLYFFCLFCADYFPYLNFCAKLGLSKSWNNCHLPLLNLVLIILKPKFDEKAHPFISTIKLYSSC